jgi:hypothetical protein
MEHQLSVSEFKSQLASQAVAISEIREMQVKISSALLGGLDTNSVGLLEHCRILRSEVAELNKIVEVQKAQITELAGFRSDIKKIVAAIAFAMPIAFELVKSLAGAAWTHFKNK